MPREGRPNVELRKLIWTITPGRNRTCEDADSKALPAEAHNGPFSSAASAILDRVAAFASRRKNSRVFRGCRGRLGREGVNTHLPIWHEPPPRKRALVAKK